MVFVPWALFAMTVMPASVLASNLSAAVQSAAGRQAQGLRLSIPIHDRMDLGAPSAPATFRLRGFAVRKRFGRVAITRDCRSFAPSPS